MNQIQTIQEITLTETFPLRSKVLLNGGSFEQCVFTQDGKMEAVHYGLKEADALIAIISMYKRSLDLERLPEKLHVLAKQPAWQVRGMAVAPQRQRLGHGKRLLEEAFRLSIAKWSLAAYAWCYSLPRAAKFYDQLGFITIGEFEMKGVGPLVTMYRPFQSEKNSLDD
jgi:GNAT superfamily N-acetyltransferase